MSKVSNMSMEEIFNKVDIKFDLTEMPKICADEYQRNKICEMILDGKNHREVMINSENYINKEKLLLVTYMCYKKEIEKNEMKLTMSNITLQEKAELEQEIRDLKNNLVKIKKLSRDIDVYLTTVHTKDDFTTITVISSKEEILGIDFTEREKSNAKVFDYIDKNLLEDQSDFGMKYAIQTIEYEDFEKVMPYDVAKAVEYRIKKNSISLGKEYIEKFKEKQKKRTRR